MTDYPTGSAAAKGLASCHMCMKLTPVSAGCCPRCGSHLHLRVPGSLQRTTALLITAAILYIPANVLPIMVTDQLGTAMPSTKRAATHSRRIRIVEITQRAAFARGSIRISVILGSPAGLPRRATDLRREGGLAVASCRAVVQ